MTQKRPLLKLFILTMIITVSPNYLNAAPVINSASGSFADGSQIVISGSSFGSHSLDITWLGGKTGNIEQGNNGSQVNLPSGWSADSTSSSRQRPVYSTTKAHSGTKSIKSYFPNASQYTSGYNFNYGGGFSSAYITWWVHVDSLSCGGSCAENSQWKVIRLTPGQGSGIYADQPHNWYWPQQVAAPSASFVGGNSMFLNFCLSNSSPSYDSTCYADRTPGGEIYRGAGIVENKWQRVEMWVSENNPASSKNGTIMVDIWDSVNAADNYVNYNGNTKTKSSSTPQWQYVVFENYFGNGLEYGNIYADDHYIQFGTRARVEICNASTWSARRHCEIQQPTAWNATSINVVMNQGSFGNGTAYLYVIDSNGAANASGYPISIGGGATPSPPAVPSGFKLL